MSNFKIKKVYPDNIKDVFDTLTITGNYQVIGSASLEKIKYNSDYDLQEFINDKSNNFVTMAHSGARGSDEQVKQILEDLTEAEPEQIVAAVTQLLAAEITSDQATEIASSPEVLAAITEDQAEELFEQIDVEELTEEQLEEFTAAIQGAPTKIKKAFEKTIDVFGSRFEDYIPTGSNIPVRTRRTLVAAGALLVGMSSSSIKRK